MYNFEKILQQKVLGTQEMDALWESAKEGDVESKNKLKAALICMGIHQVQIICEKIGIDSSKIFGKLYWGYFEKLGENQMPPSFYIKEAYDYVNCNIEKLVKCVDSHVILTEEYQRIVDARRTMRKEPLEEVSVEALAQETGMSVAVVEAVQKQLIEREQRQIEQEQMVDKAIRKWEELVEIFGEDVVHKLSERQLKILRYRCCGDDGKPKSLSETAEFFGISRERVRQIESKVSRRPHVRRTRHLKDYLD